MFENWILISSFFANQFKANQKAKNKKNFFFVTNKLKIIHMHHSEIAQWPEIETLVFHQQVLRMYFLIVFFFKVSVDGIIHKTFAYVPDIRRFLYELYGHFPVIWKWLVEGEMRCSLRISSQMTSTRYLMKTKTKSSDIKFDVSLLCNFIKTVTVQNLRK